MRGKKADQERQTTETPKKHNNTINQMHAGRQEAKVKGVKFGRKKSVNREQILLLRSQGMGAADIALQLKVARSAVYKIIDESKTVISGAERS